ncbi:MAG: LamG domain-containing protein [Candidatus Poribacteria bacterium]
MKNSILILISVLILSTGLVSNEAFGQQYVTNGLISYWTFDKSEINGEILKDVFGKNDATIKGAPQTVKGKIDEALAFDGVKDLVEVPINEDLSREGSDAMTVEAWLNVELPAYGVICGRDYWIFHWTTEKVLPAGMQFYVGVGGWKQVQSKTTVKDGWHHWAGVYDGKELKIYLDGVKDSSMALSGKIAGTGDGHAKFLSFGKDYHTTVNATRWNKVIIDEVRIYKRGLSDDEIMQNFKVKSNTLAVDTAGKVVSTWANIK